VTGSRIFRSWKVVVSVGLACVAAHPTEATPVLRPTAPPVLHEGAVLVWARDFDQSGLAQVTFDARTKTVSFVRGNVHLTMRLRSTGAQLNRVAVRVPAPPYMDMVESRVMVPARFVLDALGLSRVEIAAPVRTGAAGLREPAIRGRVLYAGMPQPGIVLRLVRAGDFSFVPDVRARTDAEGRYSFSQVPGGAYRVYAYVDDNPGYFNRVTARFEVTGRMVEAPDINLGRILEPEDPPRGAILSPAEDMVFTWSPCPQATRYHLSVVDPATNEEVFSGATAAPRVLIDLSRMSPGHQYEWRVAATDAAGAFLGASPGSGAEPWTFSLAIK